MSWRPSTDLSILRERARLLSLVRAFFAQRDILEVETPLLCTSGVTDPSIDPFLVKPGDANSAETGSARSKSAERLLQTSPEYAMKRLLAAHGEPIYQISKAFREGEVGARHNPEFTLLEWYRPGLDHHQLMDEVAQLMCSCLGERPVHRYSYRELFMQQLGLDPMTARAAEVEELARKHVDVGTLSGDMDLWLDLLMSHVIEPQLAGAGMYFVYDYPASQAALAQVVVDDSENEGVQVGQRFELYVDGMELANGYRELTDAAEQRRRFECDNEKRRARGRSERALDENLLAAMEHGLPQCSGVALGLDRLLMLMTGSADIRDVVSFGWDVS